jgi:hypothetical protein
MSFRTKLEKLVAWVLGLSAEDKPQPGPEPLRRKDWQDIRDDLHRASKTFAKARIELIEKKNWPSFLAEVAGDLAHEAEALRLRAHLLSRRAPLERGAERAKLEAERAKLRADRAKLRAERAKLRADRAKFEAERAGQAVSSSEAEPVIAGEEKATPRVGHRLVQLLTAAQGTLETAHEKLGRVEHPDAVSAAFEEELDVLAEMTLNLRQRCERLELESKKAGQTATVQTEAGQNGAEQHEAAGKGPERVR